MNKSNKNVSMSFICQTNLQASEWVVVCWHFCQDCLLGIEWVATPELQGSCWLVDLLEGTEQETEQNHKNAQFNSRHNESWIHPNININKSVRTFLWFFISHVLTPSNMFSVSGDSKNFTFGLPSFFGPKANIVASRGGRLDDETGRFVEKPKNELSAKL